MADIISTLPDDILCQILSFLETKQSAATSILSKRWIHLCLSVSALYFDTDLHFQTECSIFNDFMNSVLLARDATLPIKSFHFKVGYGCLLRCPIISITKWINFVVQRRVEYLYLHLSPSGSYPELPVTILTCKTLVVLKLSGFNVNEGCSSVVLPSLKTLHLTFIGFPKPRDFIMFLSGCPVLEELHTFDVTFYYDESLTCTEWKSFCLSNLTRADIRRTHSYFPLKAVNNTPSLCLELNQEQHYGLIPTFHNLTQLELISLRYSCQILVEVLNHSPMLQKLDLRQEDIDILKWKHGGPKFIDLLDKCFMGAIATGFALYKPYEDQLPCEGSESLFGDGHENNTINEEEGDTNSFDVGKEVQANPTPSSSKKRKISRKGEKIGTTKKLQRSLDRILDGFGPSQQALPQDNISYAKCLKMLDENSPFRFSEKT
ncbi:F-box/LRR-repeat protein At4g14103-like [Vicia villosa]|uniref:F-box/LRR-repeat protein At4g14103-like n=1 Tax=Vicia villosa TaxID=3911 RepID=UPI00273B073D|nr:F-box/LRR-repeat protein At4g14103-like [Vicia villosa]